MYFRENRYPDNRGRDPYLTLLFNGAYMVDALAKARRGDGIEVGCLDWLGNENGPGLGAAARIL